MRHNVHPLNFDSTIDTWNEDIGAHCLMLLDIFTDALCFTFCERFTLNGGELANGVVFSYLFIG